MLKIPGYQFIEQVGEGGMAKVFKALKTAENRVVAIKIIKKEMLERTETDIVKRFKREAQILSMLKHSNIVKYFNSGEIDHFFYIVTEFLGAGNLMDTIHEPFSRKIEIMMDICDALNYSHRKGVIHRDLKPSNILISQDGVPKITDFGISTLRDNEWTRLTASDMIVGTVAYMSPEQQFRPSSVDGRSDIYSLGAILYQYFTGREAIGRFPLPTDLYADFPELLEEIILKCLEYEPTLRYHSAGEAAEAMIDLMHVEFDSNIEIEGLPEKATVASSDDFQERLGIWIQTLKGGGVQQQLDAEKILKRNSKKSDLPRLLSILKTESEEVRWVLIQVIGDIGDTSAVNVLIPMMDIPSLTGYVIEALGKIGGRVALTTLMKMLPSKTLLGYKGKARYEIHYPEIIQAISSIDELALKSTLKFFLNQTDERTKESLLKAISRHPVLLDSKLMKRFIEKEKNSNLKDIARKLIQNH